MKHLPVVIIACALLLPLGAAAQSLPKAFRWIVPSAPGDGSDTTARLVGDRLAQRLGVAVVIDNKPGAGGVIGSEAAAKSAPDGATMIVGNAGSHGINAAIFTHLTYDVVNDFAPVAMICAAPNVMVINPKVPAKTVAEFIAYAKAHPGQVNYASGGVGSSSHLSAELFKSMTGVEMTHVPYKGAVPANSAVLAGEATVMIGNLPPLSGHIKDGRVRALAVTTATRYHGLPDVPALAETLPGFETVAWFGLLAPAATPKPIIERVNKEVNAILAEDLVKSRLQATGCDAAPGTPEAFAARIHADVARWKKLAAERNIHAD
ncbi:MAG TPA: tripartite tricarboxylate transporter substrate binding protein [Burkholderiales bacterium]